MIGKGEFMKDKYDDLEFEDLIIELEKITNTLENENSNLDESVKLFEKGIIISKKCNEKLEKAERKITMLINDETEIREENFIPEE